jgi:hypothetical protein
LVQRLEHLNLDSLQIPLGWQQQMVQRNQMLLPLLARLPLLLQLLSLALQQVQHCPWHLG